MKNKRNSASLLLKIEYLATTSIRIDPDNERQHSSRQLAQLKAGISKFGLVVPLLVDEANMVIAGHARLSAALSLEMPTVPVIRLEGLAPHQRRALAIAENRHGDNSSFDRAILARNLRSILEVEVEYDFDAIGFDHGEVDLVIDLGVVSIGDDAGDNEESAPPDPSSSAITKRGDTWLLCDHRIICGDARSSEDFSRLLGDEKAQMIISDAPYNVPIQGHVSGNGKHVHREFVMASGEMSKPEFTGFLTEVFSNLATFSRDGSIHYHFMDWRHLQEILTAGDQAYAELKALCVWNKTNAGLGSLYRSQHELIFVFKNGTAKHINNIQLSRNGRFRTNVWTAPGANTFRPGRDADLEVHSTVKSLSLYTEAMRDCSARGGLVLDPFAGSGTILLAAEATGRRAAAMELDPLYVDSAIRRWQATSGKQAVLESNGRSFAELEIERARSDGATSSLDEEEAQ